MNTKTLRARLWLLGIASVLGVALLAATTLWYAQRSKDQLQEFVERFITVNSLATKSYANGLQTGQALRNILLDPGNQRGHDNYANAVESFGEQAAALIERMRRHPVSTPRADELEVKIRAWRPKQDRVIELVKAQRVSEAMAYLNAEETPAWREVRAILMVVVANSEERAAARNADLIASLEASERMSMIISLLALLLVALATFVIGRGVLRQVGGEPTEAALALRRIAGGDLTQTLNLAHGDRESILAAAVEMQAQLGDLIGAIHQDAQAVLSASEKLQHNAGIVSAAAQEQSDATSAIAAATEELTVSIGAMSDHAGEALNLSQNTESQVRQGLEGISLTTSTINKVAHSMAESTVTMEELSKKVININGIARTIHEIADQTNLLALNAAIEAARAGEQGRGFAVVADEVRNLAARTASSTVEISEMLSDIQNSSQMALNTLSQTQALVQDSAASTQQVQSAVSGLDESAAELRSAINSIQLGLHEQSMAGTDIAQRVEMIAQGIANTNQAAASSSSYARELLGLSQTLRTQVSRFRTRS
ncbi:methyl-accepting chemotaxis protein [Pseudomonas sp.]|uniref:methyl-accepting chemotaxis protein n=1 Tax=Pseudomonas sp. TaxID=306 RepID=UPI0019DB5607|nr:methyl-accepting chemotaxis protein [Pseudomonas sp.]MBF0673804.1 methyl-accepting chemotaxis protein [Pseudomonas sp.]